MEHGGGGGKSWESWERGGQDGITSYRPFVICWSAAPIQEGSSENNPAICVAHRTGPIVYAYSQWACLCCRGELSIVSTAPHVCHQWSRTEYMCCRYCLFIVRPWWKVTLTQQKDVSDQTLDNSLEHTGLFLLSGESTNKISGLILA